MTQNKKNILFYAGATILVFAVFALGIYVGFSYRPEIDKVKTLANKETPASIDADFNPFWKVWNTLNEKSIYSNKIKDQGRVWGAAQGLAASLGDPYTVFFNPEESKLFNDTIHGSFSGIGAEIGMKDKVLTIIAPLKNTPSWNAGLKAGDKILRIDKKDTTDMSIDKAIGLIRGQEGTEVTLTILRSGENKTREFSIKRQTIEIPTIDTEMLPDNIFQIKFYSFSENSASLFRDALQKFINSGSHKLIIDLRGNPGGYLDSAINIASWFIEEGKVIVREDFGDKKKEEVYRSRGPKVFTDMLKLVVLVDGGSASASEILAGALKEHGVATLVGETTFGKGSVQELVNITNDTTLKVTIAKWLTPNGLSISEHGLAPDVKVGITERDIKAGIDPQLEKAKEILKAKE